MKISYITYPACFMFIMMQLFFNTELLLAQDISSNDKKTDNSASVKKPKIFFENPDFNFGKVYKGSKVEHVFKFENQGNDTLEIKKVKPSCGCTAAVLSNNTILPGETGEIKATYNSGKYRGKVKKTIAVLSNDPDTPSHKLTISGEIIQEISFKPQNINFGTIRDDNQTDKTVKVSIKSQSGPDFKITKITTSKPFVEVAKTADQKGEYTIDVTLKDYHEIGRFSGKIFMETNSTKQPKASITFYGVVEGDITINQKRIYYGTAPEGREITKKLFVKINESNIKILSTTISPDYLSVNTDERYDQRNPHCLIEIKLHKEAPIGKINGLLELYTNSKKMPVIKIPITGVINKVNNSAEQESERKVNHTDANGKLSAALSAIKQELGDIKSHHPIQLDFRLVGTVIAGKENSYAVIMDETTGKQGMYKLGESINEATVLYIAKDSIIVEKEGRAQVLRITGGNSSKTLSDDVTPSIGVSEEFPQFEPVISETGPPADESVEVKEFPQFEPVISETGPPADESVEVKELPHFEPVISETGPPADESVEVKELPHFEPVISETGPPGK